MQNFFKKLGVGYFIAAGAAALALITAIIFFPTYKAAMANNASALVPQTIGIFLIAGVVIEAALLVIPQYRFIHIGAMVMYALALFKEILLIPPLIADEINNVHYQGGNLGTNVFYMLMLVIIVSAAIAAPLVGFYKKEEDVNEDMKIKKNDMLGIAKVAISGTVVVAAILASTLIALDLKKKMNVAGEDGSYNPITPEIKKIAEEYDYSFKPSEVLVKELEEYDFNADDVKNVPTTDTRDGHNMVYYFEGAYAEGYQGDYSQTYAYLCLWEDGLFGGKVNDTQVRGYWFNSSLAEGSKDGQDIKDCLKMVSNVNHYDSIIAQEATGFYQYQAYAYLGFSWGTRSMILNGYEYYPEVALALNTQDSVLEAYVGEEYDMSSWVPTRILKNLTFSSVFKPVDVTWEAEDGSVAISYVDNNKSRGISSIIGTFNSTGDKKVTIKWAGFEADVTIKVTEAPAEE